MLNPSSYRHGFHYACSCPDDYGGVNCHLHGCGGTLTSQETPQEITIPKVTDHVIGCIWNISSPPESRINLTVKEYVHLHCGSVSLVVLSGWLNFENQKRDPYLLSLKYNILTVTKSKVFLYNVKQSEFRVSFLQKLRRSPPVIYA